MTSMGTRGYPWAPEKQPPHDLLYNALRLRIGDHNCWSADYITQLVWKNCTPAERWRLVEDEVPKGTTTLSGTSNLPRDRVVQVAAPPDLQKKMDRARVQWAEYLRDNGLRDVDVVIRGHAHLCEWQLRTLREQMAKAGGTPYHMHVFDQATQTVCFAIVISQGTLDRFTTPEMSKQYDVSILDNTAPAPPAPPSTGEEEPEGGDSPSETVKRASSISQALRKHQSKAWYMFPSSDCKQPTWTNDTAPFTSDFSDNNLTDADWWRHDFNLRAAELELDQNDRHKCANPHAYPDHAKRACTAPAKPARPGPRLTGPVTTPAERDQREIDLIQQLSREYVEKEAEHNEARAAYMAALHTLRDAQADPKTRHDAGRIAHLARDVDHHPFHRIDASMRLTKVDLYTMLGAVTDNNASNGSIADRATLGRIRERLGGVAGRGGPAALVGTGNSPIAVQAEHEEDRDEQPRLATLLQESVLKHAVARVTLAPSPDLRRVDSLSSSATVHAPEEPAPRP